MPRIGGCGCAELELNDDGPVERQKRAGVAVAAVNACADICKSMCFHISRISLNAVLNLEWYHSLLRYDIRCEK